MMEYRLIRSARCTLGLEVTPQLEVVVRAPRRLSQKEIDRFVQEHEEWILKKLEVQQHRRQEGAAWEITPEQEAAYRCRAKAILPERVADYAARMGVTPAGVKITGAKTRWGSCSGKNSLCFSWRLMLCPPEAVDYVVVHELAHIRHHNHSRDFWALVEKTMPDYKRRQIMLRPEIPRD